MPQVLKEDIRQRILAAALEVFAAEGFVGATMSTIAARAGLGAASLYRYYASKDDLFAAVITPELAERFASLLDRRVRALAPLALGAAPRDGDDRGQEMLRFWIDNRLAVVVLLDRAAGTAHAEYGRRFVDLLVKGTLAQLRAAHPDVRVSPSARFVLERIFENTRRTLAAILEHHHGESEIREAVEAFWSYQIPGLRGFTQWVTERR